MCSLLTGSLRVPESLAAELRSTISELKFQIRSSIYGRVSGDDRLAVSYPAAFGGSGKIWRKPSIWNPILGSETLNTDRLGRGIKIDTIRNDIFMITISRNMSVIRLQCAASTSKRAGNLVFSAGTAGKLAI